MDEPIDYDRELPNLSREEVLSKFDELVAALCPGMKPVIIDVRAYDAETMRAIGAALYEKDNDYRYFRDINKVRFDVADEDEVYVIDAVFALDGIEIYNASTPNIPLEGENSLAIAEKASAYMVISQEGILQFDAEGIFQLVSREPLGAPMSLEEATECFAALFEEILVPHTMTINRVVFEYVPLLREGNQVEVVPVWCFCEKDNESAYRIHAVTGEEIK